MDQRVEEDMVACVTDEIHEELKKQKSAVSAVVTRGVRNVMSKHAFTVGEMESEVQRRLEKERGKMREELEAEMRQKFGKDARRQVAGAGTSSAVSRAKATTSAGAGKSRRENESAIGQKWSSLWPKALQEFYRLRTIRDLAFDMVMDKPRPETGREYFPISSACNSFRKLLMMERISDSHRFKLNRRGTRRPKRKHANDGGNRGKRGAKVATSEENPSLEAEEKYRCLECPFTTTWFKIMKRHMLTCRGGGN